MSGWKLFTVAGIAGLHLVLVALGAAQIQLAPRLGAVGEILDLYSLFSGAGSGYGFFAPGVGTGLRVEFDILDEKGAKTTDRLEKGPTREADLRVGNILGNLSRNVTDEKTRRALSASWAGKMFAWHPEASKIVVRAETLDVPSMEDYQRGVRYDWQPMYRAAFVRSPEKKR